MPQDPSIEHEPSSHGITFGQEPCAQPLASLGGEARSPHHTPRHPPATPGAVDAQPRAACGYRRGRAGGGVSWCGSLMVVSMRGVSSVLGRTHRLLYYLKGGARARQAVGGSLPQQALHCTCCHAGIVSPSHWQSWSIHQVSASGRSSASCMSAVALFPMGM